MKSSNFEQLKPSPTQETEQMSFKQIDRKAPEIMTALANAPVYRKRGQVNARSAEAGEQITTTLASGAEETVNTANDGDWIVTNPSGEQYIISQEKFLSRYEAADDDGTYQAKGHCCAIQNPFGEPIEIMASWGEPQTGDEMCMIADVCDESGENMDGEPYLIDGVAFAETYGFAQ